MSESRDGRTAYLDAYDSAEKRGRAGESAALRAIRRAAMERFSVLGFPTSRDEEWRFTSVAPIAALPVCVPGPPAGRRALAGRPGEAGPREERGVRLVFHNGRWVPGLSRLDGLPAGLLVTSLPAALREMPELAESRLGRVASFENHAFAALNTALWEDGALVRIPRGLVLEDPVRLLFVGEGEEGGDRAPAIFPRVLVVAEQGSQATVTESYVGTHPEGSGGTGGRPYLTVAVTEIHAEEGSVVEHLRTQDEDERAFHVSMVQVRQERASRVVSHNVSAGAALARTDVGSLLHQEGAECEMWGLYVAGGTQWVDNHTVIDHASANGTSREVYKGILSGQSRAVFNGRVLVRPDSQKTDARQTNRNLLLSDQALVNTKPELQIHANDVKCTHGATIGKLDEEALFYLRARGLPEQTARGLLIQAFAAEVLARIRIPRLREEVEEIVFRHVAMPGEGRDC